MGIRKYQQSNLHQTWVGARDTSVSKNHKINLKYQLVLDEPCKEPGDESEADDNKHEEKNNADDPWPRLRGNIGGDDNGHDDHCHQDDDHVDQGEGQGVKHEEEYSANYPRPGLRWKYNKR